MVMLCADENKKAKKKRNAERLYSLLHKKKLLALQPLLKIKTVQE